jgi:hypothetical protein
MPKTLTIAQIRQRLQQARSAYDAGDYAKARALLKGIDHPKAQAMLAQIDAQAPAKAGFPCLPMALFVGVVGVMAFFGILLMTQSNTASEAPLPTLIPTSACTPTMVADWQAHQIETAGQFLSDASSASRTMPSERLATSIANLQALRASMLPPPTCTPLTTQTHHTALLTAMDAVLAPLQNWQAGTLDGTTFTTQFTLAEASLRDVLTTILE